MPEGPEVKYITNFLNSNIKGKKLEKITTQLSLQPILSKHWVGQCTAVRH